MINEHLVPVDHFDNDYLVNVFRLSLNLMNPFLIIPFRTLFYLFLFLHWKFSQHFFRNFFFFSLIHFSIPNFDNMKLVFLFTSFWLHNKSRTYSFTYIHSIHWPLSTFSGDFTNDIRLTFFFNVSTVCLFGGLSTYKSIKNQTKVRSCSTNMDKWAKLRYIYEQVINFFFSYDPLLISIHSVPITNCITMERLKVFCMDFVGICETFQFRVSNEHFFVFLKFVWARVKYSFLWSLATVQEWKYSQILSFFDCFKPHLWRIVFLKLTNNSRFSFSKSSFEVFLGKWDYLEKYGNKNVRG